MEQQNMKDGAGNRPGAEEGRLFGIMDNISEAVMALDSMWRFIYANAEAARMLGRKKEDLPGSDARAVFSVLDGEFYRHFEQAMAGQTPVSFVEYFIPLSIWLEVRIFPSGGGFSVFMRNVTDHKKAEDALKRAHEDFRNIFHAMNEDVYIVNSRYDIQYVNPALEREFGPVEGRKCYAYFHDLADVCPWCKNQEVFSGRSVQWEWTSFKTGKTYDLFDTPIKSENGDICKLELFHDITEQKQTAEALAKSRKFLTALFDHAGDAIFVCDMDGNIIDCNEQALKSLAYRKDEVLQLRVSDIDMNVASLIDEVPWKHSAEDTFMFHGVHRRKDGSTFPVEVRVGVLKELDPPLVIGIARDVTRRKLVEEALRESEARFRALIEQGGDGFELLDENGRYVDLNEATCRQLGHSREEMLGLSIPDIDPHYSVDLYRAKFNSLVKGGAPITFESVHRRKDGTTFPVEITASAIRLGNAWHALSQVRDITERKQAEKQRIRMQQQEQRIKMERQMQQTQRLESLGVLAGGIAHDFNNILTVILGNAELAINDLSPMDPARESLRKIVAASHRAAGLCRQMLAYAGKGAMTKEAIDLRVLIEDMVSLLNASISKKAELRLDIEGNLPAMTGDPLQVRQIIMNLVINASEAIGEDSGVITVSVRAMDYAGESALGPGDEIGGSEDLSPGRYLCLEVSDTGCGMDSETLERLFEPFFTTKFVGRGLGLSAVLGIVRSHKGSVRVSSEPGRGTAFRILFPASESIGSTEKARDIEGRNEWRGSGTILLVDDEESVRGIGENMLRRLGFDVLTAVDGREAIEIYRRHKADICLVMLDLTMPHMDGEESFRELKQIDADVRVVLASGYSKIDVASRFEGMGIAGVAQKPYSLDNLSRIISGLLPSEESRQ